ncbi:MAG TPA: glycosyltransferase family 39 protein, partial [Chthoniobacterales bacterium]|nr:glycosyltransferase family 39 protein [Chthoniobacterales bacterium]
MRTVVFTWLALPALCVVAAFLYVVGFADNPAGFFLDESSIAYNAYTISKTGSDEHRVAWPLYFRAFGDYKNPTYIYILSALFWLTGPSILVARLLSASAGILAGAVLGLLAARITRNSTIAWLTALSVLLTPWLFEHSRIVLELALYPLLLGFFLLCLHQVSAKETWSRLEVMGLAVTLALLTYTYSIGRLFAPLLALGLVVFCTRRGWRSVLRTWFAYGLTLIPLAIYSVTHPGALLGRFQSITYLDPERGAVEIVLDFGRHYLGNWNLWRLLIGDPSRDEVTHIYGAEHFLAATLVLSALGLWVVVRERRDDPWWRFVLYAVVVAPIPASLTNEYLHTLRLIPVPVLLLLLAIPGMQWLSARSPRTLFILGLLTVIQGAIFQWKFHLRPTTAWRLHLYDAEYRSRIFDRAISSERRPIYIADSLGVPGYIQAYWYATLAGIDLSNLIRLPPDEAPPSGALVITTEEHCLDCEILERVDPYLLYVANTPPRPRSPLPEEGFRADLTVIQVPRTFLAGESAVLRVRV